MSLVVGTPIHEPLYLGSTGQTLTREYSEIAGTETTFDVGLTDQGTGNYLVTYTPSVAGRHVWRGSSSSGIPGITFVWDVLTAAQADPVAALGSSTVEVVSPVAASGDITLYRGDAYADADGRALSWTIDDATSIPDLTGATITFAAQNQRLGQRLTATGSVIEPTGDTRRVQVEFTSTETSAISEEVTGPRERWDYIVRAVLNGTETPITLISGAMTVLNDYAD